MEDNNEIAGRVISDVEIDIPKNYRRTHGQIMGSRWDSLADGRSGNQELEESWLEVARDLFLLWQARQKKYGTGNIAAFMELGCLVRASDKIARLKEALINNHGIESTDESVLDSWLDLANYAIMGIMCHRGMWPR